MKRTYVGFGFGAIQSGLLLYEAYKSGKFSRLVVAEVVPEVVSTIRETGGYSLNIATSSGIEQCFVKGIEIYNPMVDEDAKKLVEALAEAQEIGTALPSVEFFTRGNPSVTDLLRQAFIKKVNDPTLPDAVVYTAENNNHAAEVLKEAVGLELENRVQFLNTVVGKMSGVVVDEDQISKDGLARVTPTASRAFLVEEFNRILIDQIALPGFQRGIEVFEEKDNLLPFEEAKLYGHNATHALVGYLAHRKGYATMSEALLDSELQAFAREAFLNESGAALIKKYAGLDRLFTEEGYAAYVDDLIVRMGNPYLMDAVDRIIRDPERKLSWNDRLIGTIRLALEFDGDPAGFAQGASAALRYAHPEVTQNEASDILRGLWGDVPESEAHAVISRIEQGFADLDERETLRG